MGLRWIWGCDGFSFYSFLPHVCLQSCCTLRHVILHVGLVESYNWHQKPTHYQSIFTTVPDTVCLTALKKFAEFLLILICRFCNIFGGYVGSGRAGGDPPPGTAWPRALKNCRMCRKTSRNSANFFKAVRHTLSGTVVKTLRHCP